MFRNCGEHAIGNFGGNTAEVERERYSRVSCDYFSGTFVVGCGQGIGVLTITWDHGGVCIPVIKTLSLVPLVLKLLTVPCLYTFYTFYCLYNL